MNRLRRFLSLEYEMRGLINYRLCCCANTILQALAATWELHHLLSRLSAPALRWNVPYQLHRCLEEMHRGNSQSAHMDLLRCLDRNHIQLGVQQDAHEIFLCILNLLQQQVNDETLALEIQHLYKTSVETRVKCLQCESVKTLSSYMLSLSLNIRKDKNTLDDCLLSFFEHQRLTGQDSCFCIECEKKTPSDKVLKLLSLPPILCLHLKRFTMYRGFTQKLEYKVCFPETLDLSVVLGEVSDPALLQNNCRYTLFAVAVHCGTASSGHYTAFVRYPDQQWFYADDSRVQQVSWRDVQTTYGGSRGTAYMLMYRRLNEEQQQPECSG